MELYSNEWNLFDTFRTVLWYGLSLLIGIPTMIYSIKRLKDTKSREYYIPIIILVVGVVSNIGILIAGNESNNSKIILRANYDGDTNGISIVMREDSSYEINNYTVFGGEYINGKFEMNKDTILLDRQKPIGNDFMSQKLIIDHDKILFNYEEDSGYDTAYFVMKIIEKNIDVQ